MAELPPTSNEIETESIKVYNLNSQQKKTDDGVQVSLNVEIPQEHKIAKSNLCATENNNGDETYVNLKVESANKTSENVRYCDKLTLTIKAGNLIPLGTGKEKDQGTFGTKDSDGGAHLNCLQDGSWNNNSKKPFISDNKCKLLGENYVNISNPTFLQEHNESLQKSDVSSNIDSKDKEQINDDLKNYTVHGNITTNNCYENPKEETCLSSEIQMICDNKGDSDPTCSAVVVSLENGCCSSHPYHQTDPGSDLPFVQSSSSDITGLHGYHKPTNMNEEMQNDQYENIEFSAIFSSVDMYQRSLDQSYTIENTPLSQDSESCQNFITDLDSQSYEKTMSDSGVFGLSLSDTDCLQNGVQYPQKTYTASVIAEQKNSVMFASEDQNYTFSIGYNQTNATLCSDTRTKILSRHDAGYQEYHSGGQQKSSTMTLNSAAIPSHYGHCEKPLSESCICDPYLNDYNRNYQKSLYQSPQDYTNEWNPWAHGSSATYDMLSPFTPYNKKQTVHVSSNDNLYGVEKPDVQFLQMDDKEDDEETDDADEIEHLPITYTAKHNQFWPNHLGTGCVSGTVHHGENSSSSCYGPSVLTPPPSASSTPIPPSSQDSGISEDVGLYSPWAATHYDRLHRYNSLCKLKSEQLETSLFSFGLNQATKRPFPSMADVMRRRSRSGSRKNCVTEASHEQPRRSGRPRKNQIQSDKISTTAMSKKQKKKPSKCEVVQQNGTNVMSSPEKMDKGSSKISAVARHNEPLNQHAVEIMSQWFDEHIDNPYPSKEDKKIMAAQGGITENQVKSWFANKRNRTNNTKPKVQKRAMEEKLKEIFRDLKRNHQNPMADNSRVIQQLSGIIHHCRSAKLD